jgi:hypothetical protein
VFTVSGIIALQKGQCNAVLESGAGYWRKTSSRRWRFFLPSPLVGVGPGVRGASPSPSRALQAPVSSSPINGEGGPTIPGGWV